MTFNDLWVILNLMKNLRLINVSIHINVYRNWFKMNMLERKKLNPRVSEFFFIEMWKELKSFNNEYLAAIKRYNPGNL